jgi:hypothetical protein
MLIKSRRQIRKAIQQFFRADEAGDKFRFCEQELDELLEDFSIEEDLKAYYSSEFKNRQNLANLNDSKEKEEMDLATSLSFSTALFATAGLAMLINPIAAGAAIGILLASNRWLNR